MNKQFCSSIGLVASGLLLLSLMNSVGCSHSSSSSSVKVLADITPPVRAATPAGLNGNSLVGLLSLGASDIKSRFFTSGPTNIFGILASIDARIDEINSSSSSANATCLSQNPVAYTVTPAGGSVTMYGQCYKTLAPTASDPEIIIWGKNAGVTYLYYAIGASRVSVIATPIAGLADQYKIQAWLGVGYTNSGCGAGAWDTCSYGLMQLVSDSSANTVELAAAGMGLGYCGMQIRSDGTSIYAKGSVDMGSTCNAVDTLCVLATDATTSTTCGSGVTTFELTPLGRVAHSASAAAVSNGTSSWAASLYPASPTISFSGLTSDALYFGPTTAPAGVTQFQ